MKYFMEIRSLCYDEYHHIEEPDQVIIYQNHFSNFDRKIIAMFFLFTLNKRSRNRFVFMIFIILVNFIILCDNKKTLCAS